MQVYGKTFWEARLDLRNPACFFYRQANTKFSQHVDESPTVGFGYSITKIVKG